MEKTNVYFVEAEGLHLVKIGRAKDVKERLANLRSISPAPLALRAVLPGVDPKQEKLIHRRFSKYRDHGEWFRLTPELEDFIDAPASIEYEEHEFSGDWSKNKVFISWYADTDEAKDAVRVVADYLFNEHRCTDMHSGDPEWNYISACRCVLWSEYSPGQVKLVQSCPSRSVRTSDVPYRTNMSYKARNAPSMNWAKFAMVPNRVLDRWLEEGIEKHRSWLVTGEHQRRRLMQTDYPWLKNHYAEIHEMEREQLWRGICRDFNKEKL